MKPQIIIPLTRAEYQQACLKLAQSQGILINGDSGEVEEYKVGIAFNYDGVNLSLTVTHKPFIYPEDRVEAEIRSWFGKPFLCQNKG